MRAGWGRAIRVCCPRTRRWLSSFAPINLIAAQIDSRVVPLARCIKHWTKMRNINSPYSGWGRARRRNALRAVAGTLSSYAYHLLLIFYLQAQVDPPVLPNLQRIRHSDGARCLMHASR